MKKKIIKSYFFKNSTYPITSTMFSFSKRAVRLRKKTSRITKYYKYYLLTFAIYNQWFNSKCSLIKLFNSSWYVHLKSLRTISNNRKRILYYWYLLNRVYTTKLFGKLSLYPSTGLLSSHFVHFLSKKNITYQSRSKYRSELFNMSTFNSYIYIYTAFLYKHIQIIDQKKYYFTTNHSKQSETVDEDFNKNIFNWYKSTNKNKHLIKYAYNHKNYSINNSDYNWSDAHELIEKRVLISTLHTDTDSTNREHTIQKLQLSSDLLLDITQTSLLFLIDVDNMNNNYVNNECFLMLYKLYLLN